MPISHTLLAFNILLMILVAMLLQATAVPAPQRGVPDPGVIATSQRITLAGAQSVFQGAVTGLRFGQQPGELWVGVPGSVYRHAPLEPGARTESTVWFPTGRVARDGVAMVTN